MRKAKHLSYFNYGIKLGQSSGNVVIFPECAIYLKRTWHQDFEPEYSAFVHAKFNADAMQGIQLMAFLERNGKKSASSIAEFKVYSVNPASWAETLITTVSATAAIDGTHTATIAQSVFASNELSGREVYAVEIVANRRRKTYRKKAWFNHLGCYDSIIRLRHQTEYLEALKLDE